MQFRDSSVSTSISVWFGLFTALFGLTACGGNAIPTPLPPAGAASGLNTFILFYTDN